MCLKVMDWVTPPPPLRKNSITNLLFFLMASLRLEMLDTFRDNFRSKYRTLDRGQEDRDPGLQCGDCGLSRDTQSHCMVCPAWTEARDRLDLTCIGDMVIFYQRVLKGRDDKEKIRRKG